MKGITRRDFLNGLLLGAGALLLDLPAPSLRAETGRWDGFGGEGDYAGSHGDTIDVVREAHRLRHGRQDDSRAAEDTGEVFDLVVIGGGLSGLGAAYSFARHARPGMTCLLLENHQIFGGHAKRNEFLVKGQRLVAPQASNSFVASTDPQAGGYEIFEDLGIPRRFQYQRYARPEGGLYFDRTNYGHMLWYDGAPSYGHFFGEEGGGWVRDLWSRGMEKAPFPRKVRDDFLSWRYSKKVPYGEADFARWLDTMTYKDYIEKVLGLASEVTRFADPVLASAVGLGADAVSALAAYQVSMPGFQGLPRGFMRRAVFEENKWHSFPGGNDGFVRHFIKKLIPAAIAGSSSFGEIMNSPIRPSALDLPESAMRIRLGALAVEVRHDGEPERSDEVIVTYVRAGNTFRTRARSVVAASGGLTARRIVKGLPDSFRDAYEGFNHSAILVANVALTNWRFLDRLGLTACRWFDGFGFSCNIRRPMVVGDYRPPFDPGSPAVLTFYIPFYYPGLSPREQGLRGRTEMLSTSYAEYEKRLVGQMEILFGTAGFEPKKDIAGIIFNRWGHAFVVPEPGFHFGREGRPAPGLVLRRPFGRIAFAHSELNGHQHWLGAVEEGIRAARQVLGFL